MENHPQSFAEIIGRTTSTFRIAGAEFHARDRDLSRRRSYNTIVNGLAIYLSLLYDGTTMFTPSASKMMMGRLKAGASHLDPDLTGALEELDAMHDEVLAFCVRSSPFKGVELSALIASWSATSALARLTKGCASCWVRNSAPTPRVAAFLMRWLSTCTVFFKKMQVDRPDLEESAEKEFLAFEERLSRQAELPPTAEWVSLTRRMRLLLEETYDCKVKGPLLPRHGPGVVADAGVSCQLDKYLSMAVDTRIEYLLSRRGLGTRDFNPFAREGRVRTNRYISVPKNWKKRRTISAEPAGLQYFQQALRAELYARLEADSWWGQRVKFSDQSRSRDLARVSSLTGSHATIDLSSASDSVTLALVKSVFGNSELARWLLATRSTSTLVGDRLVPDAKKFAPMGSAVCFPVETMIFTLAAELAIRDTTWPMDIHRTPVVYGDDIIVPYYAASTTVKYLNLLGFAVNTEKSYIEGHFREACGMEAWGGYDITPLRFRELGEVAISAWDRIGYEEFSRTINLVNALEELGAHDTARGLLKRAGDCKISGMPQKALRGWALMEFAASPECVDYGIVYTPGDATNFRLRRRFHVGAVGVGGSTCGIQRREYQRVFFRRRPNKATQRKHADHSVECELLNYLEWLITHQDCSEWSGTDRADQFLAGCPRYDSPAPADPYRVCDVGEVMVPTQKWVGEWTTAPRARMLYGPFFTTV